MRSILVIGTVVFGLSACGGSQRTFEELNTDAGHLYEAVRQQPRTPYTSAANSFNGHAFYDGVAYGALSDSTNSERAAFRATISLTVTEGERDRNGSGGVPTISGFLNNFVTDDETHLYGSLSFDGPVRYQVRSNPPYASISENLTGSIQSLGSSQQLVVDGNIQGAFYGRDAEFAGGGISTNGGEMGISGTWIAAR